MVSIGVQIVNCVPGAISQTCLTSGDTIVGVNDGGNDGGAVTAAGLSCGSCGTELRAGDKFCHECAAPVAQSTRTAEFKQVTVLFADVVRSMDIAATLDIERLREIMTELVERSAAVVQRYGGGTRGVHRRRGDGDLRRPDCVGGSRISGMSGRAGHPGGDQPVRRRGDSAATAWRCSAGGLELGSGDRR